MKRARARFHGRMILQLAVALLCALPAAPLAAAERLTFCFEKKEVAPWHTMDLKGLNFEILNEVAARLQIKIKYQVLPWKRCLARLQNNEVDGAFSVSFTQERRVHGVFPGGAQPDAARRLHDSRYILIRKKGSQLDWDGNAFHKVDGVILYQLGYSVGDMLRRMNVPVGESNDTMNILGLRIISGNAAAAALYASDAAVLMDGPLGEQLEMLPVPLIEKAYFLMLSHGLVAAKPALAEAIWQGIAEVRASPSYLKKERTTGVQLTR